MGKNKIKLSICGTPCSLISEDSEEYVLSVGQEVEDAIESVLRQNDRASLTLASIITALNFCDSAHKALDSADNLRSQLKEYLEESSRARQEAEEARRELDKAREELQALRESLAQKEGQVSQAPKAPAPVEEEPPTAPVQRPTPPSIQKGSFSNPLKPTVAPEEEGFMSFFEKPEKNA